MARGHSIIVSAPTSPRGVFMEAYVAAGQTPKPGTIMQYDPTVALRGGRHTVAVYNRGADGRRPAGPLWILREDQYRGDRTELSAYAAGDRCFLYCPVAGEEFNLLLADVAGTADDHPLGELMTVDDTTGKLIVVPGTEQITPFQLLEAVVDPVADQLVWVVYTGY
jgi:hypothetical protein